jgi:hypothetical protein
MLFLDANSDFRSTRPTTDSREYVPGARVEDGASVALPQQIELIAAYVDGTGMIVPPPAGVTGLTFSLDEMQTTAFAGYAMNSELDAGVDFQLTASSVPKGADNTWRVGLLSYDYGGFTRIVVSEDAPGTATAAVRVPQDENGNLLPDGGWYADGVHITDPGGDTAASTDDDPSPLVTWFGSRPWGLVGDGLSLYEEYRGFIVDGLHRRTSPLRKDLFITITPVWQIGFAADLERLGVRLHQIRGELLGIPMEHDESGLIAFRYVNFGAGGSIPTSGQVFQKALRISLNTDAAAGYFGGTYPLELVPKVPVDVAFIEVSADWIIGTLTDPTRWQEIPSATLQYTYDEAANEVRRTFGHEIGHGIAICHLGGCIQEGDPSEAGRPISVMGTAVREGPPSSHPYSQFSDFDLALIRFHRRP